MSNIFISYSSKDRELVNELAGDLELLLDDSSIWFDRELNRSGGHQWWNLICAEIRRCDVFIYALSPQMLKSEPCRREYAYARALGKPVLPVVLADVEIRYLPVELQAAQLVNFGQRNREQQRSLKQSLRNLPPTPDLPANAEALAPDAPLDPVGVLFDRIARLTTDADQQRLVILDIEDLNEEDIFQKFVPDLLIRLLERDDVLTVRNLRRVEELRIRVVGAAEKSSSSASPSTTSNPEEEKISPIIVPIIEIPSQPTYPFGKTTISPTTRPTSLSSLPAPFTWIDISDKGYSIAKYPVTNAQFAKFVEADGYNQKNWWTDSGWKAKLNGGDFDSKQSKWYESHEAWTQPRFWTDKKWNGVEQPVVGVSWYEAVAFCLWLSEITDEKIILPTEDQWQYAAQGDDKRAYPWGKEWDCKRCNNSVKPCESHVTTPVRQYEGKGDSPFGVVDMAGNVWEWCLTQYDDKSDNINSFSNSNVLFGGGWYNHLPVSFKCSGRYWVTPCLRDATSGFRLIRLP